MLDRRVAWAFAVAPYATLVGVLHQLPLPAPAMPWWQAGAHSAILFALMAAHSRCYALWSPSAPNRMLVNEFVTRTWFALFGLLLVAGLAPTGPIYLVMAAAWAVASWCTHYLLLRRHGEYRTLENLAQHGLFILGLALMVLLALRIGGAAVPA